MGKNYNLPSNIKFYKSDRKGKKYKVKFTLNGKEYIRHFGQKPYQQYKDRTPLKIYKDLDHGDKERRVRYYLRHKKTKNFFSPRYWSNNYLW